MWQISDKAQNCQYCEFAIAQAVSKSCTQNSLKKIPPTPKVYQNQSMLSDVIICGGFGFMFIGGRLYPGRPAIKARLLW